MTFFLSRMLSMLLALLWSIAAVSKLIEMLTAPEIAPGLDSWASQFPFTLILFVVLLETLTAVALIAKPFPVGLGMGIGLLAVFSMVVIAVPPTEAQSCGCLGDLASLSADSMFSRIVLLIGVHALTYAIFFRQSSKLRSGHSSSTLNHSTL